jgi:hypothetical protein
MADYATLGHYLPYLLGRRLRAVVWPADGGERTVALLLLGLLALYGAGFGFLLNHQHQEGLAEALPGILIGLNATWLVSTLLVDFFPALRPVTRPLPEHFPVSERQNVGTAFLLDLITLRRLMLLLGLLVAMLVAPRHAATPGFSVLLLLGASVLSFNVRLLAALGRWRHPLLGANLLSLALMAWWLSVPLAPYAPALGVGMALLPWLVGAAQLYWLGPYFSARYLPAVVAATAAPAGGTLGRLPLEWQVYLRRAGAPLLYGLVLKVVFLVVSGVFLASNGKDLNPGLFFFSFLPLIGFSYVNNNLFAVLHTLVANELLRLGCTARLLRLYARLVLPVVLLDCLLSVVLLVALFPAARLPQLWLLPLSVPPLLSLGLWGSLYFPKPTAEKINFANSRKNVSTAANLIMIAFALALFFIPWWWVRVPLAVLATASVAWPLRQVLRNDGALRRGLWKGIGA